MSKKNQNAWNSLFGTMTFWAKKFGKGKDARMNYSTTISRKLQNGEYENMFIAVKFVKDAADEAPSREGKYTAEINESFLTFEKWTNKDGDELTKLCVIVTDCTVNED